MPPYNPRFTLTPAIARDLATIEGARTALDLLPLPLGVEKRLRREARVRVAHNSTWIENRTLSLDEARRVIEEKADGDPFRSQGQAAVELRNYWMVLDVADRMAHAPLSQVLIHALHNVIMQGTRPGRPKAAQAYRKRHLQVGRLEYLPPEPKDVPQLMAEFVEWMNNAEKELPGPVFAAIAAYQLVTIHPFEDGNGRTCRALATLLLKRSGYGMKGMTSVESFYAADLPRYYGSLQMGLHHNYYEANKAGSRSDPDLTTWLSYFVELFARAASELRHTVEAEAKKRVPALSGNLLDELPRQLRTVLGEVPELDAIFTPTHVAGWFGVSTKTARDWLSHWLKQGHVESAKADALRIRSYRISAHLRHQLDEAGLV